MWQGPMVSSGRTEATASAWCLEAWPFHCAWGRKSREQRGRRQEGRRLGKGRKRTRCWIQGPSGHRCPASTGHPSGHRNPEGKYQGYPLRYSAKGSQLNLPGPWPHQKQASSPVGGQRGREGRSGPGETPRLDPGSIWGIIGMWTVTTSCETGGGHQRTSVDRDKSPRCLEKEEP